jgi:hypothetical protein
MNYEANRTPEAFATLSAALSQAASTTQPVDFSQPIV